jgi:hypothetical protein
VFKDGRHVRLSKAAWHLLNFEMHSEFLNVTRLPINLPAQHPVTFHAKTVITKVLMKKALNSTRSKRSYSRCTAALLYLDTLYQDFPIIAH